MKCSEVSVLLSEYVDDHLDPIAKGIVEDHVTSCESCAAELRSLRACLTAIAGMEKVSAPPDFLATVHERLEQASAYKRFAKWLFYPLRIKLPMELAGIVLATLLLVFAYQAPKSKEVKNLPAISGGVGQVAVLADEKGASLDKAEANRPASAPRRIELALLLSPPQMAEHTTQLPSLSATPSPGRKVELDRRKTREQMSGQPAPPAESTPSALKNAAKKDESLTPLDLHQAGELIKESVASLGGTVVADPSRMAATDPKTILVRIPARNYPLFLERLRRAGHLKEPPERPSPTPETAADNQFLDIRIKLIQPE